MSHEEKVAELCPVVGRCAKAERLVLLGAKSIKNGPQALSSVCGCKYVVLPWKDLEAQGLSHTPWVSIRN